MAETSQYTVSIKVVGEDALRKLQAQLGKVATQTKVLGNQQTALKATGGAFNRMGSQVQNASYQLTDFIVQVQGGTSASRAFSQQAPQLLGAFGALGASLGIVAALAPAVFQFFTGSSTTIKEAATAISDYADATQRANTGIDDLSSSYGQYAAKMRNVLEIQRQLAQYKAMEDLTAASKELQVSLGWFEGGIKAFPIIGYLERFAAVVKISVPQAELLEEKVKKLQNAKGFEAQRKQAQDLFDYMQRIAPLTDESTEAMRKLYGQVSNYLEAANRGADAAQRSANAQRDLTAATIAQTATNADLATQVRILEDQARAMENGATAANAAADATHRLTLAKATASALEDGIIDGDEQQALWDYEELLLRQTVALGRITVATKAQSEAAKASTNGTKEAEKSLKAFLGQLNKFSTPAEKAAADLDKLREYGKDFAAVLDETPELMDLYNRGLEELSIAADENKAAMKRAADSLKSSFGSAIEDGIINAAKGGKDAFKNMAESILGDIARMLIRMRIVQPLMNALFPGSFGGGVSASANGNYFPNGITGRPLTAFATGGIIGGRTRIGSNLLGENGPEAVMPLRRQNGKMGVAAAPVNVNIINNAGAEVQVSESTGNDGSKTIDVMIDSKVKEAFSSGRMDKTMRAHYGTKRVGG